MPVSPPKAHAVVVVPAAALAAVADPAVVRWLSRAAVSRDAMPSLELERILEALGRDVPAAGFAALRLWGQRGERPGGWVAAADPAFLEARLDDVHLHALRADDVGAAELATLYDDLQATLCDGTSSRLVRVDRFGYLESPPMATAELPPELLDGRQIDDFLPAGDALAGHLGLSGEIQMCLHQHPLNSARAERGQLPVNTLWLWGGGEAPAASDLGLPALFSDDPLLRGYWLAGSGTVAGSADDLPGNAGDLGGDAVITFADGIDGPALGERLAALRGLMRRGALSALTLLRRDGVRAELRAADGLRVWRRNAARVFGDAT